MSPWQAPTECLVAGLIEHTLSCELRWGLHIAELRLISRGWRDAVDVALPVLAPRPGLAASQAAHLARRFPGLRLLRLQSLSE